MIEAGHQLASHRHRGLDAAEQSGDDVTLCAARMRHALHTPLTTVQGLAYLLIEEHQGTPDLRRLAAYRRRRDPAREGERQPRAPVPRSPPCRAGRSAAWVFRRATGVRSLDETLEGPGARSGSILVIDDEEINRDLLTRRLTHQGHVVLTADSGEAGLALAARERVDLILLDVLMPGLSGYEVLSRIKADAALREIPVLMISALDQTASVTRCIALGADDYLTKPFDPLVLRARVNSCLRKKWARDFELAYLRGVEQGHGGSACGRGGKLHARQPGRRRRAVRSAGQPGSTLSAHGGRSGRS